MNSHAAFETGLAETLIFVEGTNIIRYWRHAKWAPMQRFHAMSAVQPDSVRTVSVGRDAGWSLARGASICIYLPSLHGT